MMVGDPSAEPSPSPRIAVLTAEARSFMNAAERTIRWGWKRDSGRLSRTVFYTATLREDGDCIRVSNQYFHYRQRGHRDVIRCIHESFTNAVPAAAELLGNPQIRLSDHPDRWSTLQVEFGQPGKDDTCLLARLARRRPRRRIEPVPRLRESRWTSLLELLPADLYLGSGVSYEAGLPTLCEMHQAFSVDDSERPAFAFGDRDVLPARLAEDPLEVIRAFCAVHVNALSARPTPAMRSIAALYEEGLVRRIFTDNVDNILAKVGVPFERVRGTGVLNERHPVTFSGKSLIVVGVAADRRDIISQARRARRKIAVVNPCVEVAPNVRHMTYLRPGDVFFKTTADDFFRRLRVACGRENPILVPSGHEGSSTTSHEGSRARGAAAVSPAGRHKANEASPVSHSSGAPRAR